MTRKELIKQGGDTKSIDKLYKETMNVKKKTKGQWKDYKTFTLKDGTKFFSDEKDGNFTEKR